MKVHLKNYPCNSKNIKSEPYTVNKADVTCEKCLEPKKQSKPEAASQVSKPKTIAKAPVKETIKDDK